MAKVVEHEYHVWGELGRLFGSCRDPDVLVEGPAGTGKSRGMGEFILWFSQEFPGCRIAVVRKTRVSLTQSWLVTWETKVLANGLDAYYLKQPLTDGPGRANRQSYEFKNGSELVLGGMDNPTRLFSTEYDLIYPNEATELTENDWESLHRALRNNVAPYQQLVGDCNPDAEFHWLNMRCNQGKTTRITTKHSDNPTLTPDYLARLAALSGVRRERLYLGRWCSAEGAIWPGFNAGRHVVTGKLEIVDDPTEMVRAILTLDKWEHPLEIKRFIAGVDWGFRDPFVMLCGAVDYDGRVFIVDEIYRTQSNVNWRADKAAEWLDKYGVDVFACDSAEPDMIELFNSRMGKSGGQWIARPANKDFKAGVDVVNQRFADDALFIMRDSCGEKDELLVEARQATCLIEEIPGYVYRQAEDGKNVKEEPEPGIANHATDALRYLCMTIERTDYEPYPKEVEIKTDSYAYHLEHKDLDVMV